MTLTFAQIPAGAGVFLDANTLVYHFANDSAFGADCTRLLTRIEQQQLAGFASTHVLSEVAHRLMTLEAIKRFGWPQAGIAARLRKHRSEIPKLTVHIQAIARIPLLGIQTIAVTPPLVEAATVASQTCELLMGDALIVAIMQAHGLALLASNDADFDRVPGLTRYAPI
jgi:predicted nucleic acid-binding protein